MEDSGQCADGVELFISDGGKGCSRSRVFKGRDEIECSSDSSIGRRSFGHGAVVWEEFDSSGDAFGSSVVDIDSVTAIVFVGRAKVPAVVSMWIPGATVDWCFVD